MNNRYNLKFLCRYLGGSHLYGLNGPNSDEDDRGIFIFEKPSQILGMDSHKEGLLVSAEGAEEDYDFKELRKFFHLLKKGNTQAVELLFAKDDAFSYFDAELSHELRRNPLRFVDSTLFIVVLRGYMKGEIKLANGERAGKLGGKRRAELDKHGFSPKNFVQLFRLGTAGIAFYNSGEFPVNIPDYAPAVGDFLLDVKYNPEKYTKEHLNKVAADLENQLETAYAKTKLNSNFDEEGANKILMNFYRRELEKDDNWITSKIRDKY